MDLNDSVTSHHQCYIKGAESCFEENSSEDDPEYRNVTVLHCCQIVLFGRHGVNWE